jgi:hypothetical protein
LTYYGERVAVTLAATVAVAVTLAATVAVAVTLAATVAVAEAFAIVVGVGLTLGLGVAHPARSATAITIKTTITADISDLLSIFSPHMCNVELSVR